MIAPAMVVAACGAVAAGVVDARTGYIPNGVSRTTAAAAVTLAALGGTTMTACLGAYVVGGALLALHLLTRGRGLGLGDVKLGTAIGAGCGPAAGAVALGAAFIIGGAYAAWLLVARRAKRGDAISFGPFLGLGMLTALVACGLFA
jgi:leader peptidase (prepilin peptidase) / N-methyltransferase